VRRSNIRVCLFLIALASPSVLHAAGLGNLTLNSYLGQPFKAEIDLVAVKKEEIPSLVASLASRDTFRQANVDYAPFLFTFEISVENRADGQPYIKITSPQRVVEPFLSMLIELNWSSGRLIREYTVLLDPPEDVLLPTAPAVQVEPVIPSSVKPEPAPAEQPDSITEDLVSVEEPVVQEAAPVQEATPVQEPAPVGKSDAITTYGPVKSGDTLAKIAMEVAPPNVQLNQMLIALHRANREAFSDDNMNRLKTGPILRIPDEIEIATISPDAADKEVKMQTANWEAYRQKLAEDSASIPSVSEEPTQTAKGKIITTTIESSTEAAKEPSKEESLKISKGVELGGSSSEDTIGAQDKIRSMQESATASKKALIEASTRIAMLEKSVKDLQHLLELKNALIAPVEEPPTEEKSSVEGEESNPPATIEAEDQPAPTIVPPPPAVKPLPSPVLVEEPPLMDSIGPIIDSLMENIEYVGAALLLLLTGIFGAAAIRRKKKASIDGDASYEDVISSPTDSPLPGGTGSVGATGTQADDYDPVTEAGQYLDHGRDVQAEKILKDALAKDKSNPEILAKLLEVHTLRKDKSAFETTARALWAVSPTGPLWDKAARLGLSIDPENPFYGGSVKSPSFGRIKGAASSEDAPSSPQQVEASEESSSVSSGIEIPEYKPEISEHLDRPIEFSSSQEDGVNSETSVTINPPTSDDTSIDFPSVSETESVSSIPESSPIPLPESGLEGINLNVDDKLPTTSVDTQSAEKSAQWHEIATKLDLARAYQEMGDDDGAKEILQEVVQEGDAEQQESARVILGNL
jgi:pilus assembly protein FimV